MTFPRSLLSLLLALGAASLFAADKPKSGSTEGTFLKIEQGDYTHFVMKDKKGNEESFIVLQDHKSVQPFMKNESALRGRRVRVFWKEAMIPEAGGMLKTVTKVEQRSALDD